MTYVGHMLRMSFLGDRKETIIRGKVNTEAG